MSQAPEPKTEVPANPAAAIKQLGVNEVQEIPEPKPLEDLDMVQVKREDVRGILAGVFLIGFFVILLVGMIIAALDSGDRVGSVTAVLLAISGILSGPLGFVIGYYFRSQDE